MEKPTGRALGGLARASSLTPEKRKAIAKIAAEAKRELAALPCATHGSLDHPLTIGEIEIPCYVLDSGIRVLSQRGLQTGLGMSVGGGSKVGEQRLVSFLVSLSEKTNKNKELSMRIDTLAERLRTPLKFRLPAGSAAAFGYEATILADICDVVLAARQIPGALQHQQMHIAGQAELLVRGFARVGIIALIDEATGYQKDRARDALAKVLEAYVAKELQPYIKTFDPDYYEQMFRLRGLQFPQDTTRPQFRPQYFGKLTNDIVYMRLAPGVLEALKQEAKRAEKKHKLFQHLTAGFGRQQLLKHLGKITAYMESSLDWADFMTKLNKYAPRYNSTIPLDLEAGDA